MRRPERDAAPTTTGPAPPGRWRTAADAVSAVLGLNVWVSLLFVPALFVGAYRDRPPVLVLSIVPLLALGVGLFRRSQLWLLLVYPASLLPALAFDTRIASGHVHGRLTFVVAAASLVGYLLGVSSLAAFREPPPPDRMRRLSAADRPLPARWRRRFRMYAALTGLSAVFPAVLLHAADFSRPNQAYLRELYPGRAQAMATLLNLGVLALWLGVFFVYFAGLLGAHRTGDKALLGELEHARAAARRGAPGVVFYLAVVCALALMGLLVVLRYR